MKSRSGEDVGQFYSGPINKIVQIFINSLTRICEGQLRTFCAFFSTQKSVHTYGVCAVLNSGDNVSTAKLPLLKAA